MTEENKIRDAAEAIKGVVEAVPVYQDALQPAAKEVGVALQTVAKAIHVALAPVSALVWGYETIKDFVSTRVAEKLKNVPIGKIVTPEPHVVGPALEALRWTGHQEMLRELYANLLATSLDADTCRHAHPSFVDIIRNMSPDEARIMRLLSSGRSFPIVVVKSQSDNGATYEVLLRSFSFVGREAGCEFPDLTPTYLDSLCRLGLVEIPSPHGQGSPTIATPNIYEPLEKAEELSDLKEEVKKSGRLLGFQRTFVALTDLGSQFCRVCIIDKDFVNTNVKA